METYGGIGIEGERLLRRLAKQSSNYTEREFLRHYHTRLSVVLQSANAVIAEQGIHVRQLESYRAGRMVHHHKRSDIGTMFHRGPSTEQLKRTREDGERERGRERGREENENERESEREKQKERGRSESLVVDHSPVNAMTVRQLIHPDRLHLHRDRMTMMNGMGGMDSA